MPKTIDTVINRCIDLIVQRSGATKIQYLRLEHHKWQLVAEKNAQGTMTFHSPTRQHQPALFETFLQATNKSNDVMLVLSEMLNSAPYAEDFYPKHHHIVAAIAFPISIETRADRIIYLETTLNKQPWTEQLVTKIKPLLDTLSNMLEIRYLYHNLNHMQSEVKTLKTQQKAILNMISHEFKTPLNSILGQSEQLLQQLTKKLPPLWQSEAASPIRNAIEQPFKKSVFHIHQSGRRLLGHINQFISASSVLMRQISVSNESFQLKSLFDTIEKIVQKDYVSQQVSFESDYQLDLEMQIVLDKTLLQGILLQLLSNAFHFSVTGKVQLSVCLDQRPHLLIRIQDAGVGISKEQLSHVTKPFYQVQSGLDRQVQGIGMGLFICQQYVRLLGGRLDFESTPQKGTNVWVSIPVVQTKAQELVSIDQAELDKLDLSSCHVLVCDDDVFNLAYIEMILKSVMKHTLVDGGEKAIQNASETQYDVILMDIQMPGKDGLTTMKEIRRDCPMQSRAPIIALTAQNLKGDKDYFIQQGFNDYLAKPFKEAALVDFIKKVILTHKIQYAGTTTIQEPKKA